MLGLIEVSLIDNFFITNSWCEQHKLDAYIEALKNDVVFPPIELVAEENGRYTCYDGHHRLAAHKALNRSHIWGNID